MAQTHKLRHCCRVICGDTEYASFEDGLSTFEICPVCGRQSGYECDAATDEDALWAIRAQRRWQEGSRWFLGAATAGWNAARQMSDSGLPIPQQSEAQKEIQP